MGSVGEQASSKVKLPTVKLDTTLVDIYRRACPENAGARLGWVSCGVTTAVDLTPNFPRNTKFVYQDQALITASQAELHNGNAKLQRSLAQKYLSHIPQRDAFITGNTPVIFFSLGQTPEEIEHDRRDAEATLSVLDPSQRPQLIFCSGPSTIPMKEHAIDTLEYKVVIDGLDRYPLTHDLEAHWLLNSKAGLARSGLPTPKSDVIEAEGCAPKADACCSRCADAAKDSSPLPSIPQGCTGPRGRWLAAQTHRILDAVRNRAVPFVFKTQQAFGGAGTWLVTSQEQKTKLLADLAGTNPSPNNPPKDEANGGLLRKLLPLQTPQNAHLSPTALLLTDLIADPEADYGLTFAVTSSGTALFLAAAEQILTTDGSSAWVGSTICYARQDALRARFEGLMGRIAAWVRGMGYVGLVGADVLLPSASPGADGEEGDGEGEGEGLVVDLNVRTCGSVGLPLLRGHFTSRGMGWASSCSVAVKGGRREFVDRWRGLFEEGRMVILSWYEDPAEGGSIADVVVGGEDEGRLHELMKAVRESTEEVTF